MANATLDPITGLPSSNTQDPTTGAVTSNPVTTITPESLQTPSAITPVAVPPVDNTGNINTVNSVSDAIAGTFGDVNGQYNKMLADQKAQQDAIIQAGKDLQGKTAYSQQADETAGVNAENAKLTQLNQDLFDLNGQASALKREAMATTIAYDKQNAGGAVTKAGSDILKGNVLAENAIKALTIGQLADIKLAAIKGSEVALQSAKEKAQKIVDLKYAPMESDLALRKQQYELNKDTLATIDKKRTEALNLSLKKEETQLAEKKASDKAIADMVTNAAVASAPQALLNAAKNAKTPVEAALILKEYGGDYYKTMLLKKQIEGETLKNAKLSQEYRDAKNASSTVAASTTAKNWVDQYNSGALSLEDIYTKIGSSKEALKLKNEVAALISAQGGKRVYGKDDATIQAINSQIKNVDDLLNGDVGSIVGLVQGGLGVLPDSMNIYKQDALAIAKNLVSNQTLQSLADAKAKGITFGALSEAELNAVANASGRIASKIKTEKDASGNTIVTGFSGSEAEFKKDLKTVKEGLQKSIGAKTQTPDNPFSQAMGGTAPTFEGTAIINNVGTDGSIDFKLPISSTPIR